MPRLPIHPSAVEECALPSMSRKPAHLVSRQFKKGEPSPNPAGRPKGSRNRLSASVLADMEQVWEEHRSGKINPDDQRTGITALRVLSKTDEGAFLKLYIAVLPKEVDIQATTLVQELDDVELNRRLEAIRRLRAEMARPVINGKELVNVYRGD
jgi:Family of unknown function (DUF5681)